MNKRSTTSNGDRRFTTPKTLAQCKTLAGVEAFDLDPCADPDPESPKTATTGLIGDGLTPTWRGNVFVNPPWSNIGPWAEKAWAEWTAGNVQTITVLLPDNRQSTKWWQELVEPSRDGKNPSNPSLTTHYLPGRPKYGSPGDPLGLNADSPPFGAVVLIWRLP